MNFVDDAISGSVMTFASNCLGNLTDNFLSMVVKIPLVAMYLALKFVRSMLITIYILFMVEYRK